MPAMDASFKFVEGSIRPLINSFCPSDTFLYKKDKIKMSTQSHASLLGKLSPGADEQDRIRNKLACDAQIDVASSVRL